MSQPSLSSLEVISTFQPFNNKTITHTYTGAYEGATLQDDMEFYTQYLVCANY